MNKQTTQLLYKVWCDQKLWAQVNNFVLKDKKESFINNVNSQYTNKWSCSIWENTETDQLTNKISTKILKAKTAYQGK